jgi:ATP-dependent DNA helicase RecQ
MNEALSLLADAFDDPANAAFALEQLRAQWRELDPDERTALTPLAQLAARRAEEAKAAQPTAGAAATDADLATPTEDELRAALRFGVKPPTD